jgi:signal recognition particle GTPase
LDGWEQSIGVQAEIAIAKELNLPIQYVGVGEQMEDLLPFDENNFVDSLFEEGETVETFEEEV